ncbi:MAG TPA: amidohydrolase family protein [Burkholderiaceae bacterium]|nr:amidohydrolase family protein [Burkholderiaceae bacterium]
MSLRIDAHQHFWQPARGDYAWLRPDDPALAPLLRDFLPEHLHAHLQAHGIAQTVLVQAADSQAETEFMLNLAAQHDSIGGVVGWADLSRAGAAATIEGWAARHPKFKGVRPMLQDLPAVDWIATAPHPDAVQAIQRLGLRFDALVKPGHLEPLLRFLRRWPELPVVIDHAAKPQLVEGWNAGWAPIWRQHMAEIARLPQVRCKLSGLLTEAPPAARDTTAAAAATLRPVWDALLQWFGPQRLMWGSDWPVLTLAGSYDAWVAVSQTLIGELSPDEQACVWHDTAHAFYGFER